MVEAVIVLGLAVIVVSGYIGLKLVWEKRKKALKKAASSAKRSAAQRGRHAKAVGGVEGAVVREQGSTNVDPNVLGAAEQHRMRQQLNPEALTQGMNGTDKSLYGRGESGASNDPYSSR